MLLNHFFKVVFTAVMALCCWSMDEKVELPCNGLTHYVVANH